jgi:hypothetical protein
MKIMKLRGGDFNEICLGLNLRYVKAIDLSTKTGEAFEVRQFLKTKDIFSLK